MSRVPTEVADAVVERSYGVCEVCKVRRGDHLHHRRLRSQGGQHTVENLLHVCLPCHDRIHANPTLSYERGWMLRAGDAA